VIQRQGRAAPVYYDLSAFQMEGMSVRLLKRVARAAVPAAARGLQTMTLIRGPEQSYLLQLRVLGAWWRLGSSALEPYLLLPYSLAQLKRDSLDRPLNRQ